MVGINKNLLAQKFSRASETYEGATPVQEKMAQNLFNEILRRLDGKKPSSILEIGCGTGRLTKKLSQKFPQAKITAIDIASEMIAQAKKSCPNVNYIVADAEKHLHLVKDKFDLIASSATVQWFENPKQSLQKAKSLLKEGGLIALATFADQTFHELSTSFKFAYQENNLAEKIHVTPMLSLSEWQNLFLDSQVSEEFLMQYFPNVRSFLKSIQVVGATNSAMSQSVMSRSIFRSMIKYYQMMFKDPQSDKITVNYHICYIFSN